MSEFYGEMFKWLSAHPGVLALLLVLAILTWAVHTVGYFWVLVKGGTVTWWPPTITRVRAVGSSADLKIEVGTEEMPSGNEAFYKNVRRGSRTLSVPIKYTVPFKKAPQIFLALKNIDVGGSVAGGPIDRLRLKTAAERADGFTVVFETWEDSIVYGATAATWIAFGK